MSHIKPIFHRPLPMTVFALCIGASAFGATARNADGEATVSWATLARSDIDAIHDHLQAEHPAMVDRNASGRRYRAWLDDGRRRALIMADAAKTSADYARALRFYVVGFRDGHLGVSFDGLSDAHWPDFLTRETARGKIEVTAATADAPVPIGAVLDHCDGRDGARLMEDLVVPYRANADVPQERGMMSTRLFMSFDDDTRRPTHCRFTVNGITRDITLKWHPVSDDFGTVLARASGMARPEPGLQKRDGVVFISVPTFDVSGEAANPIRALIEEINGSIAELRREPIIIVDVRGNHGGNSAWGNALATALYGQPMVDSITGSFDWTVDWRATPHHARYTRELARKFEADGLKENAESFGIIADGIAAAVSAGKPYYRRSRPATPYRETKVSPFEGKVFFLTDTACASACLDFADIMLRMPNVVHIGLPTLADAVYIDNYSVDLPSGKASLSTSMKVYRNRVRRNNEWYTPRHRWVGGRMDDAAVAAWVKTLP